MSSKHRGLENPPRRAVCLAAILWLMAGGAAAAEVRFVTLAPSETAGEWRAEIESRKKGPFVFFADGQGVAAEIEAAGDRWRVTLSGVPAEVARLSVGLEKKKGAEPQATVVVAPAATGFSDWTIYHVMLGYFRNGDPGNDGEVDGWRHPNYAGGDLLGCWRKPTTSPTWG